ncbi:SPX domain-containing membrane protein [Hibiscus syriacus]|uniref:SPX domain-containing membrane protein n=1 Tax=Hibiscus syriacus TaxID=106335 RepID=A0A6A2X6Q6_HIBSY|nr:SPX domain-containing membrane protein [Hibiscus syriacus]
MVAFGKKLKESQIQEWHGYYINYKLLKKKVNQYAQELEVGAQDHHYVRKDFSRMLDSQIEKIVLFLLEQQGELANRLSDLREQHDEILQRSDGSKIFELREAYRGVGYDLLRLLFFVQMNATGLRKILKKYDKHFAYRFTNYYVKTRADHPYSQLRQVFRHVGIGAVVGAISRNLADLQDHQGKNVSIYDQPALSHPDPVVHSIKAAVNRLSNSTSFLEFLGKHAFIMQDDLPSPSEDDAAEQRYHFILGAAATVCGVVIGSMAVAQVFSSVYFSAWSNRSYLRPLVFSSIVLLIGNTLYALAYDLNSIVVLLGRLFCGLGSARAVNRRYISDCVPHKLRMRASAGFVSASALGMACGPALACLFQTDFKIYNLTFNQDTFPGWFHPWTMSFNGSFKEQTLPVLGSAVNYTVENGFTQPLLLNMESKQGQNGDQEYENDDEEDSGEKTSKPVTSIVSAYRLLTPSVKVQLFVTFMLKYAMEILLAEASVITAYYFIWSINSVAIFLACLGLTVLPYVGSTITTFVSAEVLEGVNLLLLSRVMSSRLSRGTYNGGLLSTEAGTLARVIAGGTITGAGYLVVSGLLNVTLVPSLFICISSIVATCVTYNSLY